MQFKALPLGYKIGKSQKKEKKRKNIVKQNHLH
jgi:hypothetical protein